MSAVVEIPVLVFDLDPGEGVEWGFVVDTAFRLRDTLAAEGHDCWPKTTGGKGLHMMLPIERGMDWGRAHAYTQIICRALGRYSARSVRDHRRAG